MAAEYALNVVDKGVSCCDHTCDNPILNQMVIRIISQPGGLSPEMVEKFKAAMEKASGKQLEQQLDDRVKLMPVLQKGLKEKSDDIVLKPASVSKEKSESVQEKTPETVKGYKMEERQQQNESKEPASSGVQWLVSLVILLIVGLFVFGMRRFR